jgi:biofilm PGA synthesis N-glycosyltransferase PgaC
MTITTLAYFVLVLSFINLMRMAFFLICSDLFDTKKLLSTRQSNHGGATSTRKPLVSVLVPAHNEELVLKRNLQSVYDSTYTHIELIIINDSSTDRTQTIARSFQKQYGKRFKRIKVLRVGVRGKASALNAGLQHVKGSLFMCLDADSALEPNAISIAVEDFKKDPQLACVASHVKIFPDQGALNFFQRVEYLVGHQAKKTESFANMQYIVGGIGSMFRTQVVRKLGGYDTDTITEDIDLSMKMLSRYGTKYIIGYNPAMVTYTEAVYDFRGLMRQRFRWKYGRYQSFLKYNNLFFPKGLGTNKKLGWFYLPYALLSEVTMTLELLTFVLIATLVLSYGDFGIIVSSFLTFTIYTVLNISAATTGGYTQAERIRFVLLAPVAYIGLYVLSVVEYGATFYGFIKLRRIYKEYKTGGGAGSWKHVARRGSATLS